MDVSCEPSSENDSDHAIEEEDVNANSFPHEENSYMVFGISLMNLFKKCLADPNGTAPSEISSSFMKCSMLITKSVCNNHHEYVRKSQPQI